MADQGVCLLTTEPEDFLFEVELEDMCEEDPSTWQELAKQRWEESTWPAEETRDSTSGELLDPRKVEEGCQEELGFMSQMGVWDKVTREYAKSDPERKTSGNTVGVRQEGRQGPMQTRRPRVRGKRQERASLRRNAPVSGNSIPPL